MDFQHKLNYLHAFHIYDTALVFFLEVFFFYVNIKHVFGHSYWDLSAQIPLKSGLGPPRNLGCVDDNMYAKMSACLLVREHLN